MFQLCKCFMCQCVWVSCFITKVSVEGFIFRVRCFSVEVQCVKVSGVSVNVSPHRTNVDKVYILLVFVQRYDE